MGTPVYSYQDNPYSSMVNGFYTNKTHWIIVETGDVAPAMGSIAFNTNLHDMATSHWAGMEQGKAPNVVSVEGTVMAPANFDCTLVLVYSRNSSWT